MILIITENQYSNLLNESLSYRRNFWAWVTPGNKLDIIPDLEHAEYLKKLFKTDFSLVMDNRFFNKAFKKGYVRVIYKFDEISRSWMLYIEGGDENRVKSAIKNCLFDLIYMKIVDVYIEVGYREGQTKKINFTTQNKKELYDYIGFSE